jgi:hypothetical protein
MGKNRYALNNDKNQNGIVNKLRDVPFLSVRTGVDDIFVGAENCGFNLNFWYELKSDNAIKKDGSLKKNALKDSQIKFRDGWKGHYKIVSSFEQIIEDMNATFEKFGLMVIRL